MIYIWKKYAFFSLFCRRISLSVCCAHGDLFFLLVNGLVVVVEYCRLLGCLLLCHFKCTLIFLSSRVLMRIKNQTQSSGCCLPKWLSIFLLLFQSYCFFSLIFYLASTACLVTARWNLSFALLFGHSWVSTIGVCASGAFVYWILSFLQIFEPELRLIFFDYTNERWIFILQRWYKFTHTRIVYWLVDF